VVYVKFLLEEKASTSGIEGGVFLRPLSLFEG